MRDGVLESVKDARWMRLVRDDERGMCDAFVDALTDVALWWAYENTVRPIQATLDMKVADDGQLVIYLNDDANPPGWYHYRPRAVSATAAREDVRKRFGNVVTVPLRAMLSEQPVGGR